MQPGRFKNAGMSRRTQEKEKEDIEITRNKVRQESRAKILGLHHFSAHKKAWLPATFQRKREAMPKNRILAGSARLTLTAFAAAGNGDAVHNVPIPRQVKCVKQVDRGAAMAGD